MLFLTLPLLANANKLCKNEESNRLASAGLDLHSFQKIVSTLDSSLRPNEKISVLRVTGADLNLQVKPRIFFRFS